MIVHIDHITIPGGPDPLPKYSRVKFDNHTNHLRIANANERSDGTLVREFIPSFNDDALVVPWHNAGTRMMVADGPIPAYCHYKNSADGKITASDEKNAKGRLMRDAAINDGDFVECSPYSNAD